MRRGPGPSLDREVPRTAATSVFFAKTLLIAAFTATLNVISMR